MDPLTMAIIGSSAAQFGSSLFGGGGGESQSRIGRPEWWQQQLGLGQARDRSMALEQQLTPALLGHFQNALSGNMGLDPQMIQMMFGRQQQAMRPMFAQQQDQLRASFNPRLQGSGASAQAMGNLLTGQGQQQNAAFTDINIADLGARFGMMGQGLSGLGNMWQGNQQAGLGTQRNILDWLRG